MGEGWKHIVAVRDRGELRLYVDGKLKATSAPFDNSDYDVTNDRPLLIGLGAQNHFTGLSTTSASMAERCRMSR